MGTLTVYKRSVSPREELHTCEHYIQSLRSVPDDVMLRSVPHYVVASKSLGASLRARMLTWARRLLIDDLYRRLGALGEHDDNLSRRADAFISHNVA